MSLIIAIPLFSNTNNPSLVKCAVQPLCCSFGGESQDFLDTALLGSAVLAAQVGFCLPWSRCALLGDAAAAGTALAQLTRAVHSFPVRGLFQEEKAKPSNRTMAFSKGCLTKQLAKIATVIHQTVICPKFNRFEAQDDPPARGRGSPVVESSSGTIFVLQNF